MMTEIHKCQCHGCQSNSTDLKICIPPNRGNFHCLQCMKDFYSKFSLYQISDLDETGQEMFASTKKCHAEIYKAYQVLDDSLGTMMEKMVTTTQITWTIY